MVTGCSVNSSAVNNATPNTSMNGSSGGALPGEMILTWSHAMYVVLYIEIEERAARDLAPSLGFALRDHGIRQVMIRELKFGIEREACGQDPSLSRNQLKRRGGEPRGA